jgi:5-methylcytosine-specific restriction endonuclease McrA
VAKRRIVTTALVEEEHAGEPGPVAVLADGRQRHGSSTRSRVLVLNASYEPITVCTVRRATVLVLKQRAEILEESDWALHAESFTMPRPLVIRLTTYVRIPRDAHSRKITRRAVFARDRWTCQYCGSERGALTVDHVIPRSKGGASTWDNIVTCCAPCNRRKGDRLPKEADMHPLHAPKPPHATIFVHVAAPKIPEVWAQYLPLAA